MPLFLQDLPHQNPNRMLAQLLGFADAVSLGLALVGLYGALGHSVLIRMREFGVRLSLGLGLSFIAARTMENLIYGVKPLDPISLGVSALCLVMGALAACWLPAIRAARSNPAALLRAE